MIGTVTYTLIHIRIHVGSDIYNVYVIEEVYITKKSNLDSLERIHFCLFHNALLHITEVVIIKHNIERR